MIPNVRATSIASPLKVEVWNVVHQYLEVRSNAQSILLQTSHSEWIPIIQYLHFRNSPREVAIATGYPNFGVASFDSLQHTPYCDFILKAKSQRWLPIQHSFLSTKTPWLLVWSNIAAYSNARSDLLLSKSLWGKTYEDISHNSPTQSSSWRKVPTLQPKLEGLSLVLQSHLQHISKCTHRIRIKVSILSCWACMDNQSKLAW